MKKNEDQSKSIKQLEQQAEKLARQLNNTRRDLAVKGETNVRKIRKLRRERARVLTIASQTQLSESEEK